MEQLLEIAGTIIGVIYLWLEYKASIYLWIASIIMPAIYIFVYHKAGLYADMGINIYYLVIAFYGWVTWKYGRRPTNSENNKESELEISHTPKRLYPLFVITAIAIWMAIAWILSTFTDSNVPCFDAFTTALSIIGMYMLAQKYVEQWWVWLAVDLVSSGLYIYKELYFTAALYAIYTIIAIFGYYKWIAIMQQAKK